jgi:hypothetical protein
MKKFIFFLPFVYLLLFFILTITQVFAGPSDVWVSCCSSGCNYSPGQSVSFGGRTYYCCSNGWQTSPCPITTTTTIPPTTTTTGGGGTTTTIPQCTSLTLSPSSGPPGYTVTPSVAYSTCKICDYQGCIGSNCKGTQISTDNNPFTAPSSPGIYGYYACPGGGYATITVTQPTTTTLPQPTTTTTTPPSLPKCNSTSPTVTVLTPLVPSASSLKVSVTFSCQEWNYTIRDLKLTLYIDNNKWNECFLNETAGLVTYFGWNGTQMDDASPYCRRGCQSCGNNGRWDCDNKMNCKFRDADLWVYSNSTSRFVNITFTCKLPPLSPGSHTLTVRPVIYHSLIEMKPSKTTFMVTLSDENSILRALIKPFKVLLRIIFPF